MSMTADYNATVCCTDVPDDIDPYDPDFSDEGVWDLTEDGIPVDMLDTDGRFIAPTDHSGTCILIGTCVCCIDDYCHHYQTCICQLP